MRKADWPLHIVCCMQEQRGRCRWRKLRFGSHWEPSLDLLHMWRQLSKIRKQLSIPVPYIISKRFFRRPKLDTGGGGLYYLDPGRPSARVSRELVFVLEYAWCWFWGIVLEFLRYRLSQTRQWCCSHSWLSAKCFLLFSCASMWWINPLAEVCI